MNTYDNYEYQGRNTWEGPKGVVTKGKNRFLASPRDPAHPMYVDSENNPSWHDSFEGAVAAIEFFDGEEAEEGEET